MALDIDTCLRFGCTIAGDDFAPDCPGVREAVIDAAWENRLGLRVSGRCWTLD